jgi:hypothetical protein
MAQLLTLDDLQRHFDSTRDQLSNLQQNILASFPLPEEFNRDQYSFFYMRAARLSAEVVEISTKDLSWLPVRLDSRPEIMTINKSALTNWLRSSKKGQPDGSSFGSDFVHALTRAALMHGWNSSEFREVALHIGESFHDLSCLIGLVYYGVWMAENGIGAVTITNPRDLEGTVREIDAITRSPEVARLLYQRRMEFGGHKEEKKGRPILRVINNADKDGPDPK